MGGNNMVFLSLTPEPVIEDIRNKKPEKRSLELAGII